MRQRDLKVFRRLLEERKRDILSEAERAVGTMNRPAEEALADPTDRASLESDRIFLLRMRIASASCSAKSMRRSRGFDDGSYGRCEECGVEIGIERLKARPVTTLCIQCKSEQEEREKQALRREPHNHQIRNQQIPGYQMKVRKAVVVAAGLGTRMLPASKVIPKEILPVVDTPAIQMMVEEAIASGIEEIIVVITPGRTLVLDHFKPAPDLERQLERKGKHDLLADGAQDQRPREAHRSASAAAARARPRRAPGARGGRRRAVCGASARRHLRFREAVPAATARRRGEAARRRWSR